MPEAGLEEAPHGGIELATRGVEDIVYDRRGLAAACAAVRIADKTAARTSMRFFMDLIYARKRAVSFPSPIHCRKTVSRVGQRREVFHGVKPCRPVNATGEKTAVTLQWVGEYYVRPFGAQGIGKSAWHYRDSLQASINLKLAIGSAEW